MIQLREIVLIHDLKRQGLSVSAIARQMGCDLKLSASIWTLGWSPRSMGPARHEAANLTDIMPICVIGSRISRSFRGVGYSGNCRARAMRAAIQP